MRVMESELRGSSTGFGFWGFSRKKFREKKKNHPQPLHEVVEGSRSTGALTPFQPLLEGLGVVLLHIIRRKSCQQKKEVRSC